MFFGYPLLHILCSSTFWWLQQPQQNTLLFSWWLLGPIDEKETSFGNFSNRRFLKWEIWVSGSQGDQRFENLAVIEFVSFLKMPHLAVKDLPFVMVDTPGMCDTEGLDQDAKNVFAIQKYLNMHLGPGKVPNLILLLKRFTENRLVGSESRFKKQAACLKPLKVTDHRKSNIVVVVPHVCMQITAQATDDWETKFSQDISTALYRYGGIEGTPVAFIENNHKRYGLNFDESTGASSLPNGKIQPGYIFDQKLSTLKDAGIFGRETSLQKGRKSPRSFSIKFYRSFNTGHSTKSWGARNMGDTKRAWRRTRATVGAEERGRHEKKTAKL